MRSCLSLFVLLAACPAPSRPDTDEPAGPARARFADASAEERAGAAMAALGFGPVYATFAQFQADMDARTVDEENQPSGCPALVVLGEDPLKLRYAADGCEAPSGATYDGILEVTNPLRWEDAAGERSGRTAMNADGFTVGDLVIDGTWSQSETLPERDATSTIDLAVTVGEQTWRLAGKMALTWEDGAARTVCADGLAGSVDGLGAFEIACDVHDLGSTTSTGYLELAGEDTLRLDLTPDADGCFPATIDGQAVDPICLGEGGGGGGGGGTIDSDVFGGSGIGCGDEVYLDAQTVGGAVGGVELALAAAGSSAIEVHPLAAAWEDASYDGWSLTLAMGGYEAGVSTALSCADVETLHAVYFAYDADGEVIGCQLAGFANDPGPIDLSECPRTE